MAEQHGKALVPQIRFAGFTDPWEQRKLGELSNEFKSGEFICADNVSVSGFYPVYGGNGLRGYTTTFNHEGLYTLIGRQGALCGNVNIADGKSYFTEHAVAVKANHLNDTTFLYYLFGTLDLGQHSGQSAQPGLAVSNLVEVEAMVPDKAEQKKISRVFKTVDSLITLHQRKYDKLCVLKKSMLDKMFPKGGSLYPEIRFAGFTDPWEQRKLGEVATFGGGHTPSMSDSDNYEGGNVLWVTSQDVKSHYLDGTTTQITEKGAKELTLYPAGSLVMVTRSGILRHTLPVAELRKPSTVNQDIRVILPQGKYYGQWLLQFFISRNKELLLEFGKTGTTVESVDFSKMRDMVLLTPSLPEQQQIGHYFARLDNLITLHQRKLELLRNIKKSMLDKMFV